MFLIKCSPDLYGRAFKYIAKSGNYKRLGHHFIYIVGRDPRSLKGVAEMKAIGSALGWSKPPPGTIYNHGAAWHGPG